MDTDSGLRGSAGDTFHPARSIARRTTGSRALPASIAVSESSLGGFVGSYPVAAYHRARRQPRADDARISSCPSSSNRAAGREKTSARSMSVVMSIPPLSCNEKRGGPRWRQPRLDSKLSIVQTAHAATFASTASASTVSAASLSSLAFRWALRMWAMPSPRPRTATLLPSGIWLKNGCIS